MAYTEQAAGLVDHALLDNFFRSHKGDGCTGSTGGVLTLTGGMGISVSANPARIAGVDYTSGVATPTIPVGHATKDRFDMIAQDATGVIRIAGADTAIDAATQPKAPLPSLPANTIMLYGIYIQAGATSLTSANVFDRRIQIAAAIDVVETWLFNE